MAIGFRTDDHAPHGTNGPRGLGRRGVERVGRAQREARADEVVESHAVQARLPAEVAAAGTDARSRTERGDQVRRVVASGPRRLRGAERGVARCGGLGGTQ